MRSVAMSDPVYPYGLSFGELYTREGATRLDNAFTAELKEQAADLFNRLMQARATPESIEAKQESDLIIALAPLLERFLARFFGVTAEAEALALQHDTLAPLYRCKRLFVQRYAVRKCKPAEAEAQDGAALRAGLEALFGEAFTPLTFARHVNAWTDKEKEDEKAAAALDIAARYAVWATYSTEGKAYHKHDILFRVPKKLDFSALVSVETTLQDGIETALLPQDEIRKREGFSLTDKGATLEQALDDANYCIFCHNQDKDSCSKGLKDKEGAYKDSPLDTKLAGCPLEEKISEMHALKSAGVSIGALAAAVIDNPLCAGTGHRICNDCMKSCIYQKQEPVNIPRTETRILQDVLDLPYGFEIYALLTRWNPLNIRRPVPKKETGYKILVAGLGPAGMNLSHHLLNDGHTVIAVDGLKIEPFDPAVSGIDAKGGRVPFVPVKDIHTLFADLGERPAQGFGGVAEYGITVRWNKNYLTVMRLLLERRAAFAMHGGVRFGGTVTAEQAFLLGFDHIALCLGAGRPTVIPVKNALARGVRTASDFLMSLQLSGAARKDSVANLQMRLPVTVIGGGLTAVDTATEALAYYPVQVEKFLKRYETLVAARGEKAVRAVWTAEETEIAEEFLAHASAIRKERAAAAREGREADILALLKQWGGARIVYRRTLEESPAYRLNHEEIDMALQEGISFTGGATPVEVTLDKYGHVKGLVVDSACDAAGAVKRNELPAKAIFIAAGTSPNTVLQREDPDTFALDGRYFRAITAEGEEVTPEKGAAKPAEPHIFTHKREDGRLISFFGDLHPSYAGNVVKAMGAAKQGYPHISRALAQYPPADARDTDTFLQDVNADWRAEIIAVHRLAPSIVEIILKAPAAARAFKPGQFYRLQNFERYAPVCGETGTVMAAEGLALTGASSDPEAGTLSTIVLEMGGSSDICAYLTPGEPVTLMGPTGEPTETPGGETVILAGGGLGNAVLFSIGKAFRAAGSKVLYFAGYKKAQDRYKIEEIEAAADCIVWACDEAAFTPGRPQDKAFHGNIIEAMRAYAAGELGERPVATEEADRIIAIGSDGMMRAVTEARRGILKPYLKPGHIAIGSINSPMQCMMKEICAQCLQKHVDPETGIESYVYSCFNQDQKLDTVSFPHLRARLAQNGVQEKLTAQWIDYCLKNMRLREIA